MAEAFRLVRRRGGGLMAVSPRAGKEPLSARFDAVYRARGRYGARTRDWLERLYQGRASGEDLTEADAEVIRDLFGSVFVDGGHELDRR